MSPRKDYSKDIFNQLQEVYERFEKEKTELKKSRSEANEAKTSLNRTRKKLEQVEAELDKANQTISKLEIEIISLKEENSKLKDDNERMKRILNNNSDNSSMPPSSNKGNKSANQYNGRKPTTKKQGAQTGHSGHHLSKADIEKKIAEKKIQCQEVVLGNPSDSFTTRYKIDIDIGVKATKYIIYADKNGKFQIPKELTADVSYGPTVKALSADLYSEGVVAIDRISDLINSMSNGVLNIASGTIYGFCSKFAKLCEEENKRITANLLNGNIICADATNITENGEQTYIRNFSNAQNVLYVPSPKKSLSVLREMEIFQKFTGIFAHNHETAIYNFGTNHAECNVHLGRYLQKNTEESRNTWSGLLSSLLLKINAAKKELLKKGIHSFSEEELCLYENRFREIPELAAEEHKHTVGRITYKEETSLIHRIKKYRKNHLLFMYNFEVPYGNNMSESDLRKCKNREKMAGGFRTDSGIKMFCDIMSVIETIKHNM